MSVPTNKEELRAAITTSYQKLKMELQTIPENLVNRKELEGHAQGTCMCIHDLLAYLTGWGELVLKWNQLTADGKAVDFPETGYKWNELGRLAQKFYDDYQELSYSMLLEKLESTVTAILQLIDSRSNEELYQVTWYGKWTLGRMIQFNTSSPYANARGRIRKWKKENPLF